MRKNFELYIVIYKYFVLIRLRFSTRIMRIRQFSASVREKLRTLTLSPPTFCFFLITLFMMLFSVLKIFKHDDSMMNQTDNYSQAICVFI